MNPSLTPRPGLLVRAVQWLLIALLAAMVVLVFGNVVLRYGFNSGIDVSEELSRFIFVWLTFTGAALVLHERGHLGVSGFTDRLSPTGKRVCRGLSDLIGGLCSALFALGAWRESATGMANAAPVTSLPMGLVYVSAALSASAMALMFAYSLWRLLSGGMAEAELDAGAASLD
jgi:TRAP-type transport system small permease protein